MQNIVKCEIALALWEKNIHRTQLLAMDTAELNQLALENGFTMADMEIFAEEIRSKNQKDHPNDTNNH